MKKIIAFSIFTFSGSLSYEQSWLWGKQGNTGSDNYGVAADNKGNVFLEGPFQDTINFGAYHLTSLSGDAFLIKYDSNGNVTWAEQSHSLTKNSNCFGTTISTDLYGDVFLTGNCEDSVSFGSFTLIDSVYYTNAFLVKYDMNGNPLWAKKSTVPTLYCLGQGMAIATDISKNVYLTGVFFDTICFGIDTLMGQYNSINTFLVKFDSNGNELWARQSTLPSTSSFGYSYSIAVDDSGFEYITGSFKDTISFGAFSLRCHSDVGQMFLVKYDASGNVIWAEQSISPNPASGGIGYSVIADKSENIFVTGNFSDSVSFGNNKLVGFGLSQNGSIFLAKYNPNGNAIWAKQSYSTNGGWAGYSLAKNEANQIYFAGGVFGELGTIIFCNDTLNIQKGTDPSIILELDTAGNALCGSIICTGGDDQNGIACSSSGRFVFLGGDIFDTITFNNDFLNNQHTEVPFIARWQPCESNIVTSVASISIKKPISISPNPSTGKFTIQLSVNSSQCSVEIYNVLGVQVYSQFNIQNPSIIINLGSQPNGIYFYKIISQTGSPLSTGKLIVQH